MGLCRGAGHHLAQLPVDARVGKLLLLSASLGCLAPALTMAACLSYKSPFSTSYAQQASGRDRGRGAPGRLSLSSPLSRLPRGLCQAEASRLLQLSKPMCPKDGAGQSWYNAAMTRWNSMLGPCAGETRDAASPPAAEHARVCLLHAPAPCARAICRLVSCPTAPCCVWAHRMRPTGRGGRWRRPAAAPWRRGSRATISSWWRQWMAG